MQICKLCNKNSSKVPFRRPGRICDVCEDENRKKRNRKRKKKDPSEYEKSTTWLNSTVKYSALDLANSSLEDVRFIITECMERLDEVFEFLSDEDKMSLRSSLLTLRNDLNSILTIRED